MLNRARQITQCPLCDSPLEVTGLSCTACATKLQGVFPEPPLARIAPEHQQFIETFVRCRGVIRDVERALGISYPTVRTKLDAAVLALDAVVPPAREVARKSSPDKDARRRELLRQVADGSIEPAEAAARLRNL